MESQAETHFDNASTATTYVDKMMSSIEDMDPSLSDGFRVIYNRECPFELRVQESLEGSREVGTLEAIQVKILVRGDQDSPSSVRMEVTSESDLFFHYNHTLDAEGFKQVQASQKLMVDFDQYPSVIIRMVESCIKEPKTHLGIFVMHHSEAGRHARLDIIQNMGYKFVELISIKFSHSPSEVVQQSITYRYNSMKSRLALMQCRLEEVNEIVRLKNPSLLLQLQKKK